jgi:hypothetical protein
LLLRKIELVIAKSGSRIVRKDSLRILWKYNQWSCREIPYTRKLCFRKTFCLPRKLQLLGLTSADVIMKRFMWSEEAWTENYFSSPGIIFL